MKATWEVGWKRKINPGASLGPCWGLCTAGLGWKQALGVGEAVSPVNGIAGGLQRGGKTFLWCQ